MSAWAPNAMFLFIARALDGITAGNISVASAVIADMTDHKNRAKASGRGGVRTDLHLVQLFPRSHQDTPLDCRLLLRD